MAGVRWLLRSVSGVRLPNALTPLILAGYGGGGRRHLRLRRRILHFENKINKKRLPPPRQNHKTKFLIVFAFWLWGEGAGGSFGGEGGLNVSA